MAYVLVNKNIWPLPATYVKPVPASWLIGSDEAEEALKELTSGNLHEMNS